MVANATLTAVPSTLSPAHRGCSKNKSSNVHTHARRKVSPSAKIHKKHYIRRHLQSMYRIPNDASTTNTYKTPLHTDWA